MKAAKKKRRAEGLAIDRAVGARVRAKRQEREWTMEELGELLGVSFAQVSRYETGDTSIEPATLARLGVIFDCQPSEFLDGIEI